MTHECTYSDTDESSSETDLPPARNTTPATTVVTVQPLQQQRPPQPHRVPAIAQHSPHSSANSEHYSQYSQNSVSSARAAPPPTDPSTSTNTTSTNPSTNPSFDTHRDTVESMSARNANMNRNQRTHHSNNNNNNNRNNNNRNMISDAATISSMNTFAQIRGNRNINGNVNGNVNGNGSVAPTMSSMNTYAVLQQQQQRRQPQPQPRSRHSDSNRNSNRNSNHRNQYHTQTQSRISEDGNYENRTPNPTAIQNQSNNNNNAQIGRGITASAVSTVNTFQVIKRQQKESDLLYDYMRPDVLQISSRAETGDMSHQHDDHDNRREVDLKRLAKRPDVTKPLPENYAKRFKLLSNAVRAEPRIHGKLYRYITRWHPTSNEPQDAEIDEDDTFSRRLVVFQQLRRDLLRTYGHRIEFDNTIIYASKKVTAEQTFNYMPFGTTHYSSLSSRAISEFSNKSHHSRSSNSNVHHSDSNATPRVNTLRVQYMDCLDFSDDDIIRDRLPYNFVLQLVHVLFRNSMQALNYAQVMRSFYVPSNPMVRAKDSLRIREFPFLSILHGFMSTFDTTALGSILYIRNRTRLCEKRRISEIMNHTFNEIEQNFPHKSAAEKKFMFEEDIRNEVQHRAFITFHRRRTIHRVHDIDFSMDKNSTFIKNGQPVSYREYYANEYAQPLPFEFKGMIVVQQSRGSQKRGTIHFPPDICILTGMPPKLRQNKKMTAMVARNTSIPIQERVANIKTLVKELQDESERQWHKNTKKLDAKEEECGNVRLLSYPGELIYVHATQLPPANIVYMSAAHNNSGSRALIHDHQLQRRLPDVVPEYGGLLSAANRDATINWGIIFMSHSFDDQRQQQYGGGRQQHRGNSGVGNRCARKLRQKCLDRLHLMHSCNGNNNSRTPMMSKIPPVKAIDIRHPGRDGRQKKRYWLSIKKYIEEFVQPPNANDTKLHGIIFVLPSSDLNQSEIDDLYQVVKATCDHVLGVISQCIKDITIEPPQFRRGRDNSSSAINMAFMQFLVKLGFKPWRVLFTQKGFSNASNSGRLMLDDNNHSNNRQLSPHNRYNNNNHATDRGFDARNHRNHNNNNQYRNHNNNNSNHNGFAGAGNAMSQPSVSNYLPDNCLDLSIPTMVVGVDVAHERRRQQSTVGFISTTDPDFVSVFAQVSYQKLGREVLGVEAMLQLIKNALLKFRALNGVLPAQIIVYRDGVSLSEFEKVAQQEVNAIKQASDQIQVDYSPMIEFIVIQKRVNARFFDDRNDDGSGHGIVSPPQRTIVDSDIVSAQFWDFFLIACNAPPNKVAKPVRCIVIRDDLGLSEKSSKNDLELFTYGLCNLYYNWGAAIKIPHVVKYADRLAIHYHDIQGVYNKIDLDVNIQLQPNPFSGISLTHHFL